MTQYNLAFWCGGFVIAVFGHRQLEKHSFSYPPEHKPILQLASPKLLGGRSSYLRAYLLYVCILLIFYFVCTISEPVVRALFPGWMESGSTIEGTTSAAWPLALALLIVGFSPNFPIFAQLETAFRGLAHRIGGIPSNLYDVIEDLERTDIFSVAPNSQNVRVLAWQARQIGRYGKLCGHSKTAAESLTTNIGSVLFFYDSVYDEQGRTIWSAEVRDKFSHVEEFIKPRIESFRQQVSDELERIKATGWLPDIDEVGSSEAINNLDLISFEKLSVNTGEIDSGDLSKRLERIILLESQAKTLASQFRAVFALYLLNEKNLIIPEDRKVLRHVVSSIRDAGKSFLVNIIINNTLLVAICVFAAMLLSAVYRHYDLNMTFSENFNESGYDFVRIPVEHVGATVMYFGVAGLVSIVIRLHMQSLQKWKLGTMRGPFPITQYAQLVFVSWLITAGFQSAYWLAVNYIKAPRTVSIIAQQYSDEVAVGILLYGSVAALHAGIINYWIDILESRPKTESRNFQNLALCAIPMPALTAVIYLYQQKNLVETVNQMLVVLIVGSLSYYYFRTSRPYVRSVRPQSTLSGN